eukprot:7692426-Ditylum_brightwellii.AAC.1
MVIEHRPARMMWECDMLSRYNQATEAWRHEEVDEEKDAGAEKTAAQQLVGIPSAMSAAIKSERRDWPTLGTLPAV